MSDRRLTIYSASVHFDIKLNGISYLLYHWFFTSALLSIVSLSSICCICSLPCFILSCAKVSEYEQQLFTEPATAAAASPEAAPIIDVAGGEQRPEGAPESTRSTTDDAAASPSPQRTTPVMIQPLDNHSPVQPPRSSLLDEQDDMKKEFATVPDDIRQVFFTPSRARRNSDDWEISTPTTTTSTTDDSPNRAHSPLPSNSSGSRSNEITPQRNSGNRHSLLTDNLRSDVDNAIMEELQWQQNNDNTPTIIDDPPFEMNSSSPSHSREQMSSNTGVRQRKIFHSDT